MRAGRGRRHGAAFLAATLLASAVPAAPGHAGAESVPRRIVSLNLCTDQLLLGLVEPERIASVGPLSRDPALSFLASRARDVPANGGSGETILLTGADLVLTGPFDGRSRRALLERHGIPVLGLGLWTSLAEGRAQLRLLGERLGVAERAAALEAEIEAALARSRNIAPVRRSVLVLHRRGYTPGGTSFLDELLRHMGLEPSSARYGVRGGGTVRLERLMEAPPDYLLLAEGDAAAVDQGSALLVHPALARVVPPARRLVLPDPLTLCGGPATPAAIDALAAEIRARVR